MAKPKPASARKAPKVVARRQPRSPTPKPAVAAERPPRTQPEAKPATKLDTLVALLRARRGSSVADMMEATGWQAHSVRGALAGALKKARGLTITSTMVDGERRYRIESGQ